MKIAFKVNETRKEVDVDDDMPLVWILRDSLGLAGTKFGCGVGVCGSCTVLENEKPVRSCQIPANEAKGRSFVTIEGLSRDGTHPCQRAWLEEDVAQCGYCQPGMILNACALLRQRPNPSDKEIDDAMSDAVCRCGTYPRIRRAIRRAAALMQEKAK
jgi:aerobic-type carbon monoxide dehydrogenase small subunit (CoxS/CutS family)